MSFRILRVIVCCVGVLLMHSAHTSAQETLKDPTTGKTSHLQYFIGLYSGLGINLHTAGFGQLPGFPSCCTEYKDNTSLSPVFDALIEVPIMQDLRIQGRLGYTGLGGLLSTQQIIGNEPVIDDGPVPTATRRDVIVEHTLDATLPMIVFEPTIGYRLLDFFWLNAGLRGGYMLSSTFTQSERLFSPEGYTFTDGSTVRNQASGDIPGAVPFQFHGVLGLGYELLTKSRISLVPEVRYYFPFTKIASVDWQVQSFQLGVSLRYGMYTPNDPVVIRDTAYVRDTTVVAKPNLTNDNIFLSSSETAEESRDEGDNRFTTTTITEHYIRETPRPFKPDVRLKFVALSTDDAAIPAESVRVEELDVIENYPLLPQIFFAHNSSALDSSRQIILDRSQAQDFRAMDLTRDQIDVYRNILNVVGYRLQKNPSSSVTITGCVDNLDEEKNNKELARQRAETVKNYLVTAWGIEGERLKVVARTLPQNPANPTTPDGQQENRRVELSSDDMALFEPVEFRDRDLTVSPKVFNLHPTITNGEDINSWDATIRRESSVLLTSSGSGQPTDVRWNADTNGAKPKSAKPVIGTLVVKNLLGQSYSSSDTLNVDYVTLQLMKSREEGGKLVERYSLIVFEFNSATLNPANQRVMERVKQRIRPESKVKIVGFADRQGNPDYNRSLAQRRCEEAQRVLGLSDDRVTIEPVGSDRLVFDNDNPEGRSYSRTVHIEIETPLR
jgi:outer membrane protein OmpA-like peptidoglycan-associated protein